MAEDRGLGKRALVVAVGGASLTSAVTQVLANNPDVMDRLFGGEDFYPQSEFEIRHYRRDMQISDSNYGLPPEPLPAPKGMQQISPGKFRAADPYSRRRRF